jgi:hypothetical protein
MRIINFLLALMFLVFAFLQVNDPDPVLWILIYGAMSLVCIMAIFEFYNRKLLAGLGILFIVYSFFLWPGVAEWLKQENKGVLFDDVMKMEYVYIEESREFLGLLICLAVLVFYFIRSTRVKTA